MNDKPHHDADMPTDITIVEGKKVYTFKPRALNIVWGGDSRYWKIPHLTQNKTDDEIAELIQVAWLEITGSVTIEASRRYQISFTLSFKRNAFGWTGSPVFLMAKVGKKGKYKWKRLNELDNLPMAGKATDVPSNEESFVLESGPPPPPQEEEMRLYFGLYEVWSGKWKGGLIIHQATVKEI